MTKTEVRERAKRELELALNNMIYHLSDDGLTWDESNQIVTVMCEYATSIAECYNLDKRNIYGR